MKNYLRGLLTLGCCWCLFISVCFVACGEVNFDQFGVLEYFNSRFEEVKRFDKRSGQFFVKSGNTIGSSEEYKRSGSPYGSSMMGIVKYDIVSIDNHPFVLDVGCLGSKLFIKVSPDHEQEILQQISMNTVLVSRLDRFTCKINSLFEEQQTKEQVLYRLVENVQTQKLQGSSFVYLDIETRELQFEEMFTQVKMNINSDFQSSKHERIDIPNVLFSKETQVNFNWDEDQGKPHIQNIRFINKDSDNHNMKVVCKDCYVKGAFNVLFNFEYENRKIKKMEVGAECNFNITSNLEISASHQFNWIKEWQPLETIAELAFSVGIIPVKIQLKTGISSSVSTASNAQFSVQMLFTVKGHIKGVYNTRTKSMDLDNGIDTLEPSLFIPPDMEISSSISASILPSIGVTFFSLIDFILTAKPTTTIKYSNSNDCFENYFNSFSCQIKFSISPISYIFDGYTYTYDMFPEKPVPKCTLNPISYLTVNKPNVIVSMTEGNCLVSESKYYGACLLNNGNFILRDKKGKVKWEVSPQSRVPPFSLQLSYNTTSNGCIWPRFVLHDGNSTETVLLGASKPNACYFEILYSTLVSFTNKEGKFIIASYALVFPLELFVK